MWHNHDAISTFLLLLAADEFLRGRANRSALWASVGTMIKYFPALLLPVIWRFRRSTREAILYTVILPAVCAVVLAPFLVASPTYAIASLRAQAAETLWQTVWARVDGNLSTGIFGPVEAHLDPALAVAPQGNAARIPPIISLIAFGTLYLWLWLRASSLHAQLYCGHLRRLFPVEQGLEPAMARHADPVCIACVAAAPCAALYPDAWFYQPGRMVGIP